LHQSRKSTGKMTHNKSGQGDSIPERGAVKVWTRKMAETVKGGILRCWESKNTTSFQDEQGVFLSVKAHAGSKKGFKRIRSAEVPLEHIGQGERNPLSKIRLSPLDLQRGGLDDRVSGSLLFLPKNSAVTSQRLEGIEKKNFNLHCRRVL